MSKDPTETKIAFTSKQNIKHGHQIPDIEVSPKPRKSTMVAKTYPPKKVKKDIG